MVNWIFESEEYTEIYHQYFTEFIEKYYTNGALLELVNYTAKLIAPYVEKNPTKFCTYEEFETGVEAMRKFCELRLESVAGQLAGTIPSTSEGQSADSSNLVDASGLTISDLGTMNMGGGKGGFGNNRGETDGAGNRGNRGESNSGVFSEDSNFGGGNFGDMFGGEMPDTGSMQLPEGMEMPDMSNMEMPDMSNMQMPDMSNMQFPGAEGGANQGGVSTEVIVLLAASLVCLLAGLLVAFKYRR